MQHDDTDDTELIPANWTEAQILQRLQELGRELSSLFSDNMTPERMISCAQIIAEMSQLSSELAARHEGEAS